MKWFLQIWVLLVALEAGAVVSPSQVAYDHYFDAATFAIEAQNSADTVAYRLVMTYDEGFIRVPQGSTLTIHLRDRTKLVLATDHEVGRRDVTLRRWRNQSVCYITCRYPITHEQLARILAQDVYRLEIETATGTITRQVRRIKEKLTTALTTLTQQYWR